MQNVLVTGGAGFIGSNLVRHLLSARAQLRVVTYDLLTYAGSLDNLRELPDPDRHAFVRGDVCDRAAVDRVLAGHAIDTIVHLAAETHVDRSIAAPSDFVRTNVLGTQTLLDAARAAWGPRDDVRFHHVSTDEVYGDVPGDAAPVVEGAAYAPRSPYAASKAAADHLVRASVTTHGLRATLSNCSNNYGPHQHPEKLLPLMVALGAIGQPLPIYGDGAQIRDWLHVEDHCAALLAILERGRVGETYHIAAGNQPTNLDLVRRVCALLDASFPNSPHRPHASLIRHVADRPGHDRRYALDASRITRELGWRPRYELDDGLRAMLTWYATHGEWLTARRAAPEFTHWLESHYATRGAAAGATP